MSGAATTLPSNGDGHAQNTPTANALVLGAVAIGGFHLLEHVIQVAQRYAFGMPGGNGIAGSIVDIEPLHFIYNGAYLILLLSVLRAGDGIFGAKRSVARSLVIGACALQGFHVVEHTVKMAQYLNMGGVNGVGGIFGVGPGSWVPLFPVPLLHFAYNLLVYVPFVVAVLTLRPRGPARLDLPLGRAERPQARARFDIRPRIHRAALGWAVVAAAGASLLGMKLVAAVLFMGYSEWVIGPEAWRGPVPAQWTQLAGIAVGTAVALLAGRGAAFGLTLLLNVAILAPSLILQIVVSECTPDTLCLPNDPTVVLISQWPFLVGLLLGVALRDEAARQGGYGRNPLLEVAGAYALSAWVLSALLPLVFAVFPQPAPETQYVVYGLIGLVAITSTTFVLMSRSEHPVRDAAIVGLILASAQIPSIFSQVTQWFVWGVADTKVLNLAAMHALSALLLIAVAAVSARLVTRRSTS